jgi:hypothetical protein
MKGKILNLLIVVSSLFGYLEWGNGNTMFLFEVERELFSNFLIKPLSVMSPFTIFPLLGQLFLLITLFQKPVNKWFTFIGLAFLAFLLLFILMIGIMNQNIRMLGSAIPFVLVSILTVLHHLKRKPIL